jgi:WD40 repeat protein
MKIPNNRIHKIFVFLLLLLMTSCAKTNSPISNPNNTTPPAMVVVSPTQTKTNTPTSSPTDTQTPTVTQSPNPTISFPLKPGPIITKENAKSIRLLGAIPEKFFIERAGSQLAWSVDSTQIAVGTDGEGVRIIDPYLMKEVGEIRQTGDGIIDRPGGIAYTPDGKALAVTIPQGVYSNPGDVAFYDSRTYKKAKEDLISLEAYVLKFSHNGKWLAYGSRTVGWVIDMNTRKGLFEFAESHSEFNFVLFSWDDKLFAASGAGMFTPILVNTSTWSQEFELEGNICFSPDNKYFAMSPGIWEIEGFQTAMKLGDEFRVGVCDFGKKSDILINTQLKTGIEIWDIEKGELLNTINQGTNVGNFLNIALSPDGRFIAALDYSEQEVGIWGVLGE